MDNDRKRKITAAWQRLLDAAYEIDIGDQPERRIAEEWLDQDGVRRWRIRCKVPSVLADVPRYELLARSTFKTFLTKVEASAPPVKKRRRRSSSLPYALVEVEYLRFEYVPIT